jgi:hypothetical protein
MLLAASVPARGDLRRCGSAGCGRCRASIHQGQRCDNRIVDGSNAWCMQHELLQVQVPSLPRPRHDLAPSYHKHTPSRHGPRSQRVCLSLICLPSIHDTMSGFADATRVIKDLSLTDFLNKPRRPDGRRLSSTGGVLDRKDI